MNGMETLGAESPEEKAIEQTGKEQLLSVIIDQQKELGKTRALLKREKEISERYQKAYETLSKLDWMVENERTRGKWRDAKITPPIDSSMKWVCTFGGKEVQAFFDGEKWWTERHETVNAMAWQHLPHFFKAEAVKNG